MDTLIYDGAAVKSLGDNKIGGYLVLFTTKYDPDTSGDYFDKDTKFFLSDEGENRPGFYNHGFDMRMGNRQIGTGTIKKDDVGLWLEAQLTERDAYVDAILDLVKQGACGLSSGALSHLVRREAKSKSVNYVSSWAVGEWSITPTPAEPRTAAMPIKSWAESLKGDALGKYADDAMGADMAVAGIHSLNSSLSSHVMRHAYGYDGEPKTPEEKVATIHAGIREHGRTARRMISACLGGDKDEAKAIIAKAFTEDLPTEDEEVPTVKTVASIATIRDFEEFLREAGYSKKDAIGIALHGYNSRRDAGEEQPITPEVSPPPLIDAKSQQPDTLGLTLLNTRMEALMRAFA